ADYNDPSDYLNPMYSNKPHMSNMAQVNDEDLEDLMEQGLETIDPTAREAIYDEIQQYIVEDLMPYAFISADINFIAYHSDFIGYQWNSLGIVSFYTVSRHVPADTVPLLIFGTTYGPWNLDPHNAWETSSVDVIEQVVESLFACDLSDPDYAIIPRLAKDLGTWSEDHLTYTVELKEDVRFHDGTAFNAYAVQWNFNRLAYFLNIAGTLPEGIPITQVLPLFILPDGTPIINNVEVIDTYQIRFELNSPYAPLEALLSCWATGILSPFSTPETDYIALDGDLVGTGPFVYDDYIPDDDVVNFHAFESYWDGPSKIKNLEFSLIENVDDRNQALIDGAIDFLNNPLPRIIEEPDVIIDGGQSTTIWYLIMNNELIEKPMRQAISHAIDYMHIINEILDGQAIRLKSPVPEGILYANWGFDVATMDIAEARQILHDANIGTNLAIDEDDEWVDAAEHNPIATYYYQYNEDNIIRQETGLRLIDDLKQIGVKVMIEALPFGVWWDRLFNDPGSINLTLIGWAADYNDPSDYLNPIFSSASTNNIAQVNDPDLDNLLNDGVKIMDPSEREAKYDEIQQYIVEDLMPHAYMSVTLDFIAYRSDFIGYQWNSMGKVWFYTVSGCIHADIVQLINDLQDIIDPDPDTPLADKLKDVLAKVQTFQEELGKTPPDNQAALGNIEGAVGDLEAAVEDNLLDSEQGTQLMDSFAAIARQIAVNALQDALQDAIHSGGDFDLYDEAKQALAEGDTLRSEGSFKDAVNKYKDALAKAESAIA
ncbi:hypothetical protein KAR91_19375, partial [Candidatus Pacearchaeota archaeon]|nr:hypothetical protein [Candidatus Pacearchaeota archaeon]